MGRWKASGLHLLISILIASVVLTLMLGLWYPGPLFQAMGGEGLLFLLIGVDVILGPLITLIIFKSGKRGLKLDLTVIGLVQLCALLYGAHVMFIARPAFIAFVKDQFQGAAAVDVDPESLAQAKYPEFGHLPWGRPVLVGTQPPADQAERNRLFELAFTGRDLEVFPRYYVPYAGQKTEVLAKAQPIASIRAKEPSTGRVIDEWLKKSGTSESAVRYLPLRARSSWIAVLVDASSGEPVKMLLAEKI
jgi:hypothetical protein